SLLGLPIGDHPARPPQTAFPDDLKQPIRQAYVDSGFIES
ncbi:MAG: 4-hydroxy-tetrahydrodipicolinate synthase, partial [Mycobacterium sp.]|nr:4-hydroxy-tetrahydrodipicolinate synthase [Mycobacterium sp.]